MADEGAETPTVLPKIDFHFVLQTAASDISNQHDIIAGCTNVSIKSDIDILTFPLDC